MKRFVFSVFFLLLPATAVADDHFGAMDTDKDGRISPEEFFAGVPGMKRPAFDIIDADKDGVISHAEWDAFTSRHNRPEGMGRTDAAGGVGAGASPPHSPPVLTPPAK